MTKGLKFVPRGATKTALLLAAEAAKWGYNRTFNNQKGRFASAKRVTGSAPAKAVPKRVTGSAPGHKKESIIKSITMGGITRSTHQISYKKPRALKLEEKFLAQTTIMRTGTQICTNSVGQQQATSLTYIASTQADNQGVINLRTAMTDALYYGLTGTLGSSYTAGIGIFPALAQQKFIIDKVETTIQIFNATSVGAILDLYDLKSKTTSATFQDPITLWVQGTNTQQMVLQTYGNASSYNGSVPTTSKDFNIAWNIVKRTKIELGPGASHEHKLIFKPNIVIDADYISNYASIRNLTMAQMLVQRGTLGDTSTTGSLSGGGLVSSNGIKLDVMVSLKYELRPIQCQSRNLVCYETTPVGIQLEDIQQAQSDGLVQYS